MIAERAKKKISIVSLITLILLSLVGVKLIYTNIYMNQILSKKALDLWERSFPLAAPRGKIRDRNENDLVFNEPTMSVAIIPNQVKDKSELARRLAPLLNVSYQRIFDKISKKASITRFHPEGKKLDYELAMQIKDLNIHGVYLIQDNKRTYPYEEKMASLLGFVGIDNNGLSGVEATYENYLRGKEGSLNYRTDAKGGLFPNYSSRLISPVSGLNLNLTIDLKIQNIIEKEMENAYLKYQPEEIIALVTDPMNGEILAIGNRPTYDNNNYQDYDPEIYNRNLPVFSSYEPGSTFKALSFAAAINEKKIDIDNDTYFDKGYEMVAGQKIKSWKKGGHGLQTFLEVLENSSNPGFVEISRRLGKDKMFQYINDFGMGKKTNVDIAGENKGIIFPYDSFGPLEVATSAFGQGISVTPIQLMMGFNATINGGYLLTPRVGKSLSVPSTNEKLYEFPRNIVRQVVSEETSKTMRRALESVVAKGSGRKAFLDGYRVGGKTGTGQIAENGAYLDGEYILSFIASAPMNDPRITVYFAMKKPKNCIQYGGTTIGPIIRNILEESLPLLGVKKNYDGVEREYTWMDIETKSVANYVGLSKSKVKSPYFKFEFFGEGDVVIDQLPRVGEKIEIGKTVLIMLGDKK